MKIKKVTCVEMESSALYAFAKAKNKDVICFAHLTNTMAQQKGDFEKGDDFGSLDTLKLVEGVLGIFRLLSILSVDLSKQPFFEKSEINDTSVEWTGVDKIRQNLCSVRSQNTI